ncbi:hypothetical protein FAZ69_28525 [Trinickia terrae]|uniref:Uncharacterized protein n=1 Tax=Trinickia terrae TaxID=2571161 RepID=A0A4V5PHR2_9BURK|nr:hypothetical protein [Trinickia terrae]TKC81280.1 hypothetical protein FAZ69_28525 [Trinickia terrae]
MVAFRFLGASKGLKDSRFILNVQSIKTALRMDMSAGGKRMSVFERLVAGLADYARTSRGGSAPRAGRRNARRNEKETGR